MKIFPLTFKKKLSKLLNRVGFLTGVIIGAGSFVGGIGGTFFFDQYSSRGGDTEKAALQEKVTHLMDSYKMSQSMHLVLTREGKEILVMPKAVEADKKLAAAFEAEEKETGIALAHARHIAPNDATHLYRQLTDIKPYPDYFKDAHSTDATMLGFHGSQARVMDRPGFTPTVESARAIVKGMGNDTVTTLEWMFGPVVIGLTGLFGFFAARNRLDKSIYGEEEALRQAEEAAKAAEKERQKQEAARLAAEEAERERIASLPVVITTVLENDINVRQIKLARRNGKKP